MRTASLIVAVAAVLLAAPAHATNLARHVIGTGSGVTGNGARLVRGTAGQRLIGIVNAAPNSSLRAGFWYGAGDVVTAVEGGLLLPGFPVLHQNSPNPFNPATTISFSVPEDGPVWLDVFDVQGRHVTTLIQGILPAGRHDLLFAPRDLASGIYFYRLRADGFEKTRRMLLLK